MRSLTRDLERIVQYRFPNWNVRDFEPVGGGLECLVCRAETIFGPVAIRTPLARWSSNDNDVHVDGHELLRREALLSKHAEKHGIPVPHALHLSLDTEIAFLVSQFVTSDQSNPDYTNLGRVLAQLHALPPPTEIDLVGTAPRPLAVELAERIPRRLGVVDKIVGSSNETGARHIAPATIIEIVNRIGVEFSLLHMDMRFENLLCREGAIFAVIDWSNALIGPPALEIARIAEYQGGTLDSSFFEGYGENPLGAVSSPCATLLRIDAAVMLAVVFLSEAPDPLMARKQVSRLDQLLTDFRRSTLSDRE